MKKASLFLIVISLLCASCVKDPVDEWKRFWGFTSSDIAGHYDANPDESLYEELPTEGIVVYSNASMDVTALSGSSVSIQVRIPDVITKTFSGPVYSAESNSDIVIDNNGFDLRMTVYKNDEGNVKFHGRVQQYYINSDGERVNLHTYGFDVIRSAE
ncbi:MAG: hypothetical protein J6P73_05135 [Bacteroidales bacterium]|nr:hypothetical protein [Bacteroidales bacterium]